jgi:membrane fusion protein (multidrug efflux system)
VWVLNGEGKTEQRDVQMGPRIGENWLVAKGLKVGDQVIVDGVQRLRPGIAVKATPYVAPPAPPAPPKNAAAAAPAPVSTSSLTGRFFRPSSPSSSPSPGRWH